MLSQDGVEKSSAAVGGRCVGRGDGLCCAWLVVASSFVANGVMYGVSWSAGVFYDVFAQQFDTGSGLTALMTSLNTALMYGAGPIAGMLTNTYGHRLVAMIGGLCATVGLALSAVASNVYHLIVTFGILTGIGFSLCYVSFISVIALHFDGRGSRLVGLAFGVATTGVGVGAFVYPVLLRWLVAVYGWRGALLMTAGLVGQLCVAAAVLRPPPPRRPKGDGRDIAVGVASPPSSTDSYRDETDTAKLNARLSMLSDDVLSAKLSTRWRQLLRPDVFASRQYVVLCVNNTLLCFGLSVVYVHLFAFAIGTQPDVEGRDGDTDAAAGTTSDEGRVYTDPASAALLLSTIGAANLVGRFVFGLMASARPTEIPLFYLLALMLCGIATFLCPLLADSAGYIGLCVFSVVFGLTSACIGPLIPTLIISFLDADSLASGSGYVLVFEAIGQLLGAPAAGWLYDTVGEYAGSFYLSGAALVASSLLMLLPWRRHKMKTSNLSTVAVIEVVCEAGELEAAPET